MLLVHCLSFTVQSAPEDSDVRTEPCNRPADTNPMCLARPWQVGLKPVREKRVRWQRPSLPNSAGTAWSQAHTPYISLSVFACIYFWLSYSDTRMQILINIWRDQIKPCQTIFFFYISTQTKPFQLKLLKSCESIEKIIFINNNCGCCREFSWLIHLLLFFALTPLVD